jgi:hypothetical protein
LGIVAVVVGLVFTGAGAAAAVAVFSVSIIALFGDGFAATRRAKPVAAGSALGLALIIAPVT